jgi:glycerophosphoryl diester phosphodiesterase
MTPRRGLIRFAHRGASALAPENTLAAFQEAFDRGCEWIETDVRLTADQVPVLLHDERVDRTTGSRGEVGAMSLRQVLRLDAGSWFGRKFQGERVPTLDEALEWSRGRCSLNLELKEKKRRQEAIRQIARRLESHRAVDTVLISSFAPGDLLGFRAALPRARLAWLASRSTRGLKPLVRKAAITALHPKDRLVAPRLLNRCRRLGLAVHVWVVNRPERLSALARMEVDGVMTDDPRIFSYETMRREEG